MNCSNLQAWVEHNFDTTILDYRLSFPLLQKLADIGNRLAYQRLKEEIIKRYIKSTTKLRQFLIKEKYFKYLKDEERLIFYQNIVPEKESISIYQIERAIGNFFYLLDHNALENASWEDLNKIYSSTKNVVEIRDKKVVSLKISQSPTNEIWNHIRRLTNIERLCISGNLNPIPRWIDELTLLKLLKIHHSNVESIPESIGSLSQLVNLKINNNMITKIPRALGKLNQLKYLDISKNKYNSLPKELINLTELHELEYDIVRDMPEDFDHLIRNLMENKGYTEIRYLRRFGEIRKKWSMNSAGYNRFLMDPTSGILEDILDQLIEYNSNIKNSRQFIIKRIIPEIIKFTGEKSIPAKNLFLEFYEKQLKQNIEKNDKEDIMKELEKFLQKQINWIKKINSIR